MTATSRTPGLQVPANVTGELRAFCEAVSERLRVLAGERSDSRAKAVTPAELSAALQNYSRVSRTASNSPSATAATEDLSVLPELSPGSIDDSAQLLVQGASKALRYKLRLTDLLSLLARLDRQVQVTEHWEFASNNPAFDISGTAPRFRFREVAAGAPSESALPADSALWDVIVDSGTLTIRLLSDAHDDPIDGSGTETDVIEFGRSGMTATHVNVLADALEHLGEQVITQAGAGLNKIGDELSIEPFSTTEVDIGVTPLFSGSFDITGLTGLTDNKPVHIWQAAAAYTNKGSLPDEAEMDQVRATAFVLNATTVRVYWVVDRANGPVAGNIKFNYWIGT